MFNAPIALDIDLAAELRKMPAAKRQELFRLAGMFDDSPQGLAKLKSLLVDSLGSDKNDAASQIVSRSSVKPSIPQILRGAGKRGVGGLATRAKMLFPLLIGAGGVAGLGSAALSSASNEMKYRQMLPKMKLYLEGQ